MTKYMPRKKGFGLVEVLISVLIMGFSLFVLFGVFYAQAYIVGQLRDKIITTLAAQEEIEYIRTLPFNTIISSTSDTLPKPSSFAASLVNNNPRLGVAIDDYLYDPINVRSVTVTITWRSARGNDVTRSLSTLMTRSGINKQ